MVSFAMPCLFHCRCLDTMRPLADMGRGWPRGGVVTQRTANPCTPVRFRARPPKSQLFQPVSTPIPFGAGTVVAELAGKRRPTVIEPQTKSHSHPSVQSPGSRRVDREDREPHRDHPESQHRQETEQSSDDQSDTQSLAQPWMPRNRDLSTCQIDLRHAFRMLCHIS